MAATSAPPQPPESAKAGSYVYGTSGNDTLTGTAFNNYLSGGSGQDTASGGKGDDTYGVEGSGDTVVELAGEGIDTVESYGSYVLSANVENLKLLGSNLTGTGNELANRITGGSGNDVLNGKAGNDWLTGGAGADTFVFERGTGQDVITDFAAGSAGTDVVRLSGYAYTSFAQVQAAMTQVGLDTVLTLSDGSGVTFLNRTISQFTPDDFGFAAPVVPAPTYTIAGAPSVGEGGNLVFTVSRSVDNGAQTVSYGLSGTATSGSDYTALSGTVSFAAGELSKQITLTSLSDSVIESSESVIVTLNAITGTGSLGPSKAATGTIVDRTSVYSVSGAPSVDEGGNLVFTVSRSLDNGAQTVSYNLGGTATSGLDYTAPSGTVTFAAGELSKQITVTTLSDTLVESGESVSVTLGSITGLGSTGSGSTTTGNIVDVPVKSSVPAPPESAKAGSYVYGTSGNDTLTGTAFNNYLSGGSGQDTASGGKGDDTYGVEGSGDTVVELAGEGIDTVESYGSYVLSANVENLKLLGSNLTGTGNELANRITGGSGNDVLNGKAGNDWLTGGAGADTFVFERGTGQDVITDFAVGSTGTDVVRLSGYTYTSFAQVQAAMTQVGLDTVLTLSDGSGVTFLNRTISQFTPDDFGFAVPTYTISGAPSVNEGGNLVFTVSRTLSDGPQTVSYGLSGTATSGLDYTAPSGTVAFAAGELSKQIVLTSLSDTQVEGGETVIATLNAATGGGAIGTSKAATGTIVDRTSLYAVSGLPTVDEGGNLVFTVSRSLDNGAQTISYTLGGTATSGVDYTAPSGSVSFAALEMNKQVVLAVSRDWLNEGSETAILSLTSVTGQGSVTSSAAAATTIVDTTPLPLPVSGKAVTFWSGTGGNDTYVGDDRNNALNGQGGVDTLSGGKGDDTYVVDYVGDVVTEQAGEGIDTVESYAKSSYTLSANVENLKLLGTYQSGIGNELANRIVGGSGTDYLDGRAGDDWLTGGAGNDQLTGGDGVDRALFSSAFANYDFRWLGTTLEVSHRNGGADGTDQLTGIELLDFAGTVVERSTAAPITKGDVASGTEDQTLSINVLANDVSLVSATDLRLERLAGGQASLGEVVAKTADGKGTITLGADNKLLFTPGAAYDFLSEGQTYDTSFVYKVANSTGLTSSAAVQLSLTGRNDAPTLLASQPSHELIEARPGNDGVATSVIHLTKADADGTAQYDLSGWLSLGGTSYLKYGTYGSAVLDVAVGTLTYALNNESTSTQDLGSSDWVADTFQVGVTDGSLSPASLIQFTIAGRNDVPTALSYDPEASGTAFGRIAWSRSISGHLDGELYYTEWQSYYGDLGAYHNETINLDLASNYSRGGRENPIYDNDGNLIDWAYVGGETTYFTSSDGVFEFDIGDFKESIIGAKINLGSITDSNGNYISSSNISLSLYAADGQLTESDWNMADRYNLSSYSGNESTS